LESSINEDSVYAGARLLAVADGIGDPLGGDIASQTMVAALADLDDVDPGEDILGKLDAAVRAGNYTIRALRSPDYAGMGTTLTAILFAGNRFGLAHIGGSRGYLLRDGELTQITTDEIATGPMVDHGRHYAGERSLMMRRLRGGHELPTLTMREARAGDRYLLCTHGLSDWVGDPTIREGLQISDTAKSAVTLIEMALRNGAADNITVVVADVLDVGVKIPT
jgi:protein phosphatase